MRRLCIIFACALAGCSQAPETKMTQQQMIAGGHDVYAQYCSGCHQPEGKGVPNMQPPLAGNAIVNGDPKQLIRVVLQGPAAVLPANRPHFQNTMPPFAILTDQQVAELLTYIRASFGNNGSAVQPLEVAAVRATLAN